MSNEIRTFIRNFVFQVDHWKWIYAKIGSDIILQRDDAVLVHGPKTRLVV